MRSWLAQQSERELGRPLRFERLGVSFLPPSLRLHDAVLEARAPETVPPLRAERVDLELDLARLFRGERDADVVSAVVVQGGHALLRLPGATPDAGLELTDLAGRAATGSGVAAEARIVPGGRIEAHSRPGEGPFATALEIDVHDGDARALAPWLAGLHVGDAAAGRLAIEQGRIDGRVRLEGAMVPDERLHAELALVDARAGFGEATLRGRATLKLDLDSLRTAPGGRFALDARDAEVVRNSLQKEAGQPFEVSGRLAARRDGQPGFAFERVRIAPLVVDLDAGGGVPIRIRIGGDAADAAPADGAHQDGTGEGDTPESRR
ncbi:MAG TPA: hypothetical protein VMW35_03860 [Myxococcota bacterium]|nr:hypothetical protein [Myxococcota bacterium]